MNLKRCSKCGTDRPLGKFVKDSRYKDGRGSRCSVCKTSDKKEWREKLKRTGEYIPQTKERLCLRCNHRRSIDKFGSDLGRKDGLRPYCKKCDSEYHKEWSSQHGPRKRDKAYGREIQRRSRIRNKEKNIARRIEIKKAVFKAYGGEFCKCCGVEGFVFLTLDHIDPGAKKKSVWYADRNGGIHLYECLFRRKFPVGYQVLCWNCNSAKHLNGGICPHQQQIEAVEG